MSRPEGARWALPSAVFLSGAAGLTWELLWQHHAALLLGVSAEGTAITLACMMGGMAVGAWVMGRSIARRAPARPRRAYAVLELCVALAGALLSPGFELLSRLDVSAFRASEGLAPLVQIAGTSLLCGVPAAAMGATLPVLALAAAAERSSLARLYAMNVAGAAAGVLASAFALLPAAGVSTTIAAAATANVAAALLAWFLDRGTAIVRPPPAAPDEPLPIPRRAAFALALSTGFVTLCLEVAWFRSFRAAFQATTDSFALVLVAVLVPLAAGAALARRLPRRPAAAPILLGLAGTLGLAVTPIVERMDRLAPYSGSYGTVAAARLCLALATAGPPMLLLGAVFPWLLDRTRASDAGRLAAVNTLGAVLGALAAAWLLLPSIGFARTAWLAGGLLAVAAVGVGSGRWRWTAAVAGLAGLALAVAAESGAGRIRAQGAHLRERHRLLATREGPDATVSVVVNRQGARELVIDGFQTSGEAAAGHYMEWMGRLPMLAHPAPRRALVIGFGTGRTANAVRLEGVERLDVAEVSPAVVGFSDLFPSNGGVLGDARVRVRIMDGRAWLRRTRDRYDVITLEPMPPHFAGMNALYSREFYETAAARLAPGGVVAQWLPLHLVAPLDAASVARAFVSVFPDALLWVDPYDRTGILLGRRTATGLPPLRAWPGFARPAPSRDLSRDAVDAAVALCGRALGAYAAAGDLVTDDNQLLAYGAVRRLWRYGSTDEVHRVNLELLRRVARVSPSP